MLDEVVADRQQVVGAERRALDGLATQLAGALLHGQRVLEVAQLDAVDDDLGAEDVGLVAELRDPAGLGGAVARLRHRSGVRGDPSRECRGAHGRDRDRLPEVPVHDACLLLVTAQPPVAGEPLDYGVRSELGGRIAVTEVFLDRPTDESSEG